MYIIFFYSGRIIWVPLPVVQGPLINEAAVQKVI